ncbi:MAG: FAD:protein transferase [Acidimicrobiaceae bacterium]
MDELRFRAMGTDAHVVVVDGPPELAAWAAERIDELERLWSRFLPDSEISRLTATAGTPAEVSTETAELIARAIEAWRFTGGTFDPTVLGAVIRAGYDRTFDDIREDAAPGRSDLVIGCTDITVDIDARRVCLPAGTGFDPGGIGKGFAADVVATEVMARGAAGVCINLGGDLRAVGAPPEGEGWTVAIEHPCTDSPLATVGIRDGAAATSTTLRRRWSVDGEQRHHLIDPRTGEPAHTDLTLVTVIAGEAWSAEVLAKSVLLRGSAHPFDLIEGSGAEALIVDREGAVRVTDGFRRYLGYGWIPEHVDVWGDTPGHASRN